MNKSRRSGVAAMSTVSGGSSGSAAGTPTPPVVSPVTGPVSGGAAVGPDNSVGVHCSAALGVGENSAFRSLVPQHLQPQEQQQKYGAPSESSEEINVTTDDEDDDELRGRHHHNHNHRRHIDGNEQINDANGDGNGDDDNSNDSSSSYNNNNNEDDNNDENGNGKTAVFTQPHFGDDANRQPYFIHHGLHHSKRPIDHQHHHHHHNNVLSTIASWREMAVFTALHHEALGQGAAKIAADAAVANVQPLQLTKYDKDRA